MDEVTTKVCTGCGEDKPLEAFAIDRSRKDGRTFRCKLCFKLYRDSNKKQIAKSKKKCYENKKSEYNARVLRNYHKNPLPRKLSTRKWSQSNPDKVNAKTARRRALKKACTVEKVDYRVIRERDDSCYLCFIKFTEEERWSTFLTHVDHKIPLVRIELNPTHSYANCALTHKACNLTKNDKTPEEYWATLPV